MPPPVASPLPPRPSDPSQLPPTSPEWRMSDPGPLPEPRGRRRWLWGIVGILGLCVLLCVALTVWSNTDSGARFFQDIERAATEAQQTREAGE